MLIEISREDDWIDSQRTLLCGEIDMSQEQIVLQAAEGACKAHVLTPQGAGPWPGVIFYMDGFGIRPGMIQMASRVAAQGYVVLLPDLFYRYGAVRSPSIPRKS